MTLLILSDIHGNLTALHAVLRCLENRPAGSLVLLGDLIDYGPHSNEVVSVIKALKRPFVCNIWGNHEHAIMSGDYGHFSSQRGVDSARHTKTALTDDTKRYLLGEMDKEGKSEFFVGGKKFLALHASLENHYWGKFDIAKDLSRYSAYDAVFLGHSHRPFFYEAFFQCDNPKTRNQKKTIFINPGSVGQPRNINCNAQFAVFDTDTENCEFVKVPYAIVSEQKDFSDNVDDFYKNRLEVGV